MSEFVFVLIATVWSGAPFESEVVGGYAIATYSIEEQCTKSIVSAAEFRDISRLPTFECVKVLRPLL